jgi:hypothetical protein
LIIIVNIPIIF